MQHTLLSLDFTLNLDVNMQSRGLGLSSRGKMCVGVDPIRWKNICAFISIAIWQNELGKTGISNICKKKHP